jgi:linoleoyl-CoA desaturase
MPQAASTLAHPAADESNRNLKFNQDKLFQVELKRRIDEFFVTTGRQKRDCWQMYLKTFTFLLVIAVSYILLVFFAATWWQALPLAILLGLTTAGIGFNIQHDAGHQAYSSRPWVNKIMSMTLDLMGGSSYVWHWKHGVIHHTYVNITDHDTDIDLGIFARLTPHQHRHAFHRWQHLYMWPLYGFLAIKWHLVSDFQALITGRIGQNPIPRPKGWDLFLLIAGKTVFFTLAFGIPLLLHPVWMVLATYAAAAAVLGLSLAIVFQLAHAVEEAEFPMPQPGTGRMENAWAIHQVQTTVDFVRHSTVITWLLGGLNFQIEHHLFPRICHINYPAMSKIVEATCRDYGVKYTVHKSLQSGLSSHFRWLRLMGLPNAPIAVIEPLPQRKSA